MKKDHQTGFTLIELSIVLVIIGLIVGGIFTGQDLIHAALLRNTQKQIDEIKLAATTFRIKYNCLPGDCSNATSFLPAGNCNGASESTMAACNGDGDGQVDGSSGYNRNEDFYFWRELNAAQLFTLQLAPGAPGGVGGQAETGTANVNRPQGVYSSTSILFIASNIAASGGGGGGMGWGIGPGWIPADYTDAIVYGTNGDVNGWGLGGPSNKLMTFDDAQSIDTKYDDGSATTGSIIEGGGPYCVNLGAAGTGNPIPYGNPSYGVGTGKGCSLVYLKPF
jgi:prepilin-type N-terminal cleavage/methylation domain-containing protein